MKHNLRSEVVNASCNSNISLNRFSWSLTHLSSLKFQALNPQSTFNLKNSLALGNVRLCTQIFTEFEFTDGFTTLANIWHRQDSVPWGGEICTTFLPAQSPVLPIDPRGHFSSLAIKLSLMAMCHHCPYLLFPSIFLFYHVKGHVCTQHLHTFLVEIILNQMGKVTFSFNSFLINT